MQISIAIAIGTGAHNGGDIPGIYDIITELGVQVITETDVNIIIE